jgi:hypothetical protein
MENNFKLAPRFYGRHKQADLENGVIYFLLGKNNKVHKSSVRYKKRNIELFQHVNT